MLLRQEFLRAHVIEQAPECDVETGGYCYLLDDAGYIIMSPSNDTDHLV